MSQLLELAHNIKVADLSSLSEIAAEEQGAFLFFAS
jgi:hypothetical protein